MGKKRRRKHPQWRCAGAKAIEMWDSSGYQGERMPSWMEGKSRGEVREWEDSIYTSSQL